MKKSSLALLAAAVAVAATPVLFGGCYYDKEEVMYPESVTCDTLNVTYHTSIRGIFQAHCLACHGAAVYANSGDNLNLDDYSQVKGVALDGTLLKAVRHESGVSAMPKNSPQLVDCKIDLIRRWVAAGAPNN